MEIPDVTGQMYSAEKVENMLEQLLDRYGIPMELIT